MVVVYVILVAGIGAFDFWPLYRDRRWSELLVYTFLLAAGLFFIIMDSISYGPWRISNPLGLIFKPIFQLVKHWLMFLS